MENSTLITIASIEKGKEFLINVDENFEPQPERCIYTVPENLRKIKEEAYTPKVISIGPLHYGKRELVDMEKEKIRYKREFSKRISPETWQEFINFIEKNEKKIRNCYENMPKIEKLDFVTMILYDAIFIIELLLTNYETASDLLLDKKTFDFVIYVDLSLLENQLPYFVLNGLYELVPKPNLDINTQSLFSLSCTYLFRGHLKEIPNEVEVKHFVDLRRYVVTQKHPEPLESELRGIDLPCATKLQESGVQFKVIEGQDLLDIKFELKKPCIPLLKNHYELQIPRIEVYDETECLLRNVMALEQYHYTSKTIVCSYIDLLDNLINTEEDVNLLVDAKIIVNHVGDTARIVKMFNELCLQIHISRPICYNKIVKNLKEHYENPCNHAMATLKRVYFSNYWRGTGTIAAIVLLFLTLIQAVCSILQVV
ncbi:hypothetical protein OWV82_022023 [Melia azedarach]|uniref:Uncharacterized protein n=1 Tax=Melia azedarach TaxID=155640 RepID=A0ACC1X160_MELAZ|nr:hypothetical protein OWV82_022023 [Melia azedarach]